MVKMDLIGKGKKKIAVAEMVLFIVRRGEAGSAFYINQLQMGMNVGRILQLLEMIGGKGFFSCFNMVGHERHSFCSGLE